MSTRWSSVYPPSDLVFVNQLRVTRFGHPAVALHDGQAFRHPLEVCRAGPNRLAQVGGGHERSIEVRLLGEQADSQSALSVDLAPVRFIAARGEAQ